MNSNIKLSEVKDERQKVQLLSLLGYDVRKSNTGRYYILGIADCIDNDFKTLDEILLLCKSSLKAKGFNIAA